MPGFRLIRRPDGLIYHFALGGVRPDPGDGMRTGRVWDIAAQAQADVPPASRWVTAKATKVCVCDLQHDPRAVGRS